MNKLKFIKKKNSGRDSSGKVSVRHQGGEQKRYIRVIDFKRDKRDIEAKVVALEYDPNRTWTLLCCNIKTEKNDIFWLPQGLKLK